MKLSDLFFFICIFIIFYTYVGYGILIYILVKIKDSFYRPQHSLTSFTNELPEITLFIAAYNEEEVIDEKMRNCLEINYPADKLNILWVTDGSNDRTNEYLSQWKQAKVLFEARRSGKTAAINRGIKYVTSPIVVFTDANAMINKESLQEIASKFTNPRVGCVAGEKRIIIQTKSDAASGGEGLYWKYESFLKSLDSRFHSTIGAAGELFAIRRELFEEMDATTLLDDFILSMRIAMRGYIIAYCPEAYASESGSADMQEEEKRKTRIAAGGLQSIWRLRDLLNIFKYGWLSFQYISHRVLRWSVAPILLFLILPINLWLIFNSEHTFLYIIIFLLQATFYLTGLLGYRLSKRHIKNKILFIPYYFLFMNLNVIKGCYYLYKHKSSTNGTWKKAARAKKVFDTNDTGKL